jgi:hypothetical protein
VRVLFQLPRDYPVEDAPIFAAYVGGGSPYPYSPDNVTVDLLWPLSYQDGELVLTTQGLGYLGAPYSGIAENDYFFARFPLRRMDELGCK